MLHTIENDYTFGYIITGDMDPDSFGHSFGAVSKVRHKTNDILTERKERVLSMAYIGGTCFMAPQIF